MKSMLLAAVAAVSLMPAAHAADAYKFALIPKGMDNPYFDLSRDGCMAEAKKIGVRAYVTKSNAAHTLVKAIDAVLRGEEFYSVD